MIVNKYNNGGGGSASGVTPEQVQQQIDSALTYYWESGETKDYVDEAVSGISLDGYYTSAQTEEKIASAVTPVAEHLAEVEQVTASGYNELHTQVLELSARTPDLSAYYTSAQTDAAIAEAVSGKADAKIMIDFDHTTQAERAAVYAELKALYDGGSGATINKNYDFYKTVNTWQGLKIDYYTFSGGTLVFGQVVSPENLEDQVAYVQVMEIDSAGNVTVQTNTIGAADMSGYYTSAQTEQAITSKNYVTSGQVETQITSKNYITNQALTPYTPTTGFSTINGSAITNGGNIVIQGGGGDTQELQDQIDTLDEVVSQALVDLDGRVDAISAATPDLSPYWTSAQTENAISAATQNMVVSTDVKQIVKLTQSAYDQLATKDPYTFYIIITNSN